MAGTKLPIFNTEDQSLSLMQTKWAAAINPVLVNPMTNGLILQSVPLVPGDNVISHKLGRNLQGWMPVRLRAATTLFDKQDANTMPNLTLVLNSTNTSTVDLYVF